MADDDEMSLPESLSTLESGAKRSDKTVREETISAARLLIQQDTKLVRRSKICLILFIMVAAAFCSFGVYKFTTMNEEADFEVRFTDCANEIITVWQINAQNIFQIFQTMSRDMTGYAHAVNAVWPFVLFADFEAMSYHAINHTGTKFVGYTPIVQNKDRQAYENFTYQNQEWIQRGLDYMGMDDPNASLAVDYIHCSNLNDDQEKTPKPKKFDYVVCPESDEYAPIAQLSPVAFTYPILNYDAFQFDYFVRTYNGMIEAGGAVLSHVLNLVENATSEPDWPVSYMVAPIYQSEDHLGQPENLVGVITGELPWHSYFQNLIPEGIDGIHLVVSNTCDQVFTYVINGPKVIYRGPDDYHYPEYDSLEIKRQFTTFPSIPECQYEFRLYPTPVFEVTYQTNAPVVNAVTVFIIFFVTAFVFVVYDILVQRRQNKLLSSAERTGALVNSLFPENVRERIIADAVKDVSNSKDTFGAFRRDSQDEEGRKSMIQKTKPIADLFPNATILFGDLVGFTAWSSSREPTEVFILLETLYGEFDKIARKLGVFKVETIGDCYLAVAGLPEPRDDHAVIMARFARKCMIKLNQVVHELEGTLGTGTSDLAMRIGLHSGPVTAGVLRGEKSRFQLFGDTVNTAARMESTGMKNKIQISQQTAELLVGAGKAGWVKPREDVVVAKGKGELQTFWVTYPNSSITNSNESNHDEKTVSISQSLSSSGLQGRIEEANALSAEIQNDKEMES